MKRSHKHIPEEELFMHDLFKDFEPEEAPASIKQKAMDRVLQDWSARPVTINPVISKENTIWIIVAIVVMAGVALLYDTTNMEGFNHFMESFFVNSEMKSFQKALTSTFSWMGKIPSILIWVSLAIGTLLGADRLLNRLANI
ncbi:hypothetical protein DMA11_05805 [Marinilabiliaceae bacterium JC017]|nr:hypothetical protein DMA11_05805 [Marinilabiliaceae bacterium JC017]